VKNKTLPVPEAGWKDVRNQRYFFEELGKELNIKNIEDWKNVQAKMVRSKGGNFINAYYNGSVSKGEIIY
jgi:hypothetical protein